jgi:hypothetical protein
VSGVCGSVQGLGDGVSEGCLVPVSEESQVGVWWVSKGCSVDVGPTLYIVNHSHWRLFFCVGGCIESKLSNHLTMATKIFHYYSPSNQGFPRSRRCLLHVFLEPK